MKRWQLVQDLFAATADLDVPARARLLRERADGDQELIRDVESLVAASVGGAKALDRTASDLLQEIADEPSAEDLCGQRFGPYRIDAHLSTGGMGHVYLATRTSEAIERRVAIKVLRPGLVGAGIVARFQRERATLAGLEHENIVAFLDAAALPDGRPYLVMEYVDGVPLTQWIVERGVGVRQRLEMFLQILSAVQCAHRNLVIHRDLKPSNVLVNAQGVPKLCDFGVAAMLAPDRRAVVADDEDATAVPMTPGYASPEQFRGESVTTASDVYSLGIMLREVLTACPSDRPLSADLAAITSKATALNPIDRYASADRFADDLRRHLVGEPVSARSNRWSYRMSCMVRRNRWPLLGASAVMLALVVGWVGSDLSRRRAEHESSVGWGAHAQAKLVSRIYEDLVASIAANHTELGALAVAHLENVLQDQLAQPGEGKALARLALARLYLLRRDYDEAMRHADQALLLCQTVRGLGEADLRRARDLRQQIVVARDSR